MKLLVATVLCVAGLAQGYEHPPDKALFHDTGNLLWRDCGGGDSWLSLTKFDMTPSPLTFPGNAALTLPGVNNGPDINQNVALVSTINKRLLNRWTRVPCTGDLGSCVYTDTCHFVQVLFPNGECPQEFTDNGLPCTCPFSIAHGKQMTLTNDALSLGAVSPTYSWLTTGEYYIKLQMYEKGQATERMCLDFYVNFHK